MIRLHYSNRLESLIAPLAGAVAAQQRAHPLDRVTVVVPGRVIEHFLQHRVSEAIGIAANLNFPFLRRFLSELVEAADPAVRILEVEELELVLFESLRAALQNNSEDFHAPRDYIENGLPAEGEKELRTFRLARQLAKLFREYSIARRSMLQQWIRAGLRAREHASETERWERQLWLSTFDAKGCLRREWRADDSAHRWSLLPDAFEALPAAQLKVKLPAVVHVFGLAYAGPAYLRMLSQIGDLTELHLYALNPCLEFWEDVPELSSVDRARWTRRRGKIGGDPELTDDPFNLAALDDTPALRLWARPGREYIRMLNEVTQCDFNAHFVHHNASPSPSLLACLQEDILNRAPARAICESDLFADDASIRFLACPGMAREAEIVANEIWSMLEHDSRAGDPLRFHQIAAIVPDALYDDYLPHLENAFSRLHQLPMNIVSRAGGSSPVREAVSLLLRLPLGRFTRDELLHLLNHPAIRGEDAEVDIDQAGRWCEDLGIFFGADGEDLANTYIPRDTYHWDQGIRRLVLGVFIGGSKDEEPRFYSGPESAQWLPYETAQDETPAVARFVRTARGLLSDANEIRSRELTLPQWSRVLSDLVITYVKVRDSADEGIRERCIAAIESIAATELRSERLSYQLAHEIASARLAETESQRAQFAEQGIAIGPVSALQGIPFRAVFLLGLNEGQFPERDRRDPLDLRLLHRKAGDVTPIERDRYLFLGALLAARERIFLSYLARDSKTGDHLEPSSMVRELQFILQGYVNSHTLEGLTIEHPLSRYDSKYFPDLRSVKSTDQLELPSYDSEARRGAAMGSLRSDLARYCDDLPLPGRDEPVYRELGKAAQEAVRPGLRVEQLPISSPTRVATEISLPIAALRKFLECPLQGAAQYALGIFEDDGNDLEQWQDEPIAQSILNRTVLLREVFWKARGDRRLLADAYQMAFRLSQLKGEAPAGPFAQAAELIDRANIEQWIVQSQVGGCGNLDRWTETWMGPGDRLAKPGRIVAELLIPLPKGVGADTQDRVVRLHGSLGFVSPAGNAILRPVLRDKPKAKDFLGPFLSGLVLAAAKQLSDQRFDAIVVGAGKNKSFSETRSLDSPTPEQAGNYLSNLVSDLLFDRNHYYFPIEAVEEVDKEIGRGRGGEPLLDLVYDARDNEFASCSSDYGPIRNARRFDPPSLEAMMRILDRRFRLIRKVFEGEKG